MKSWQELAVANFYWFLFKMESLSDQVVKVDVGYEIPTWNNWTPLAKFYHPLQAGSIDGTDTSPHDKAVTRAMEAKCKLVNKKQHNLIQTGPIFNIFFFACICALGISYYDVESNRIQRTKKYTNCPRRVDR